jgi:hypothetical protein
MKRITLPYGLAIWSLPAILISSAVPCFAQAPVTNGLAARWTGDGNAKDSAGHHDGTVSGALTYTPGPAGAQAFQFGGSNLYGVSGQLVPVSAQVDFGSEIGNFGTRDFTVAFWLKTTAKYAPTAFLGKRSSCDARESFWEIQIGSRVTQQAPPGFLIMQMFDGGHSPPVAEYEDRNEFFSSHAVNDGKWHHAAWVRQSTSSGSVSYLLYLDGALDNSKVYPEAVELSNQAPLILGQSVCQCCDGSQPYIGGAAELQLFSHALTAEEVLTIYKAGKTDR